MALVVFVDETTSGERSDARHLDVAEERLTLREVIRRRVFQEVAERSGPRRDDPDAQYRRAIDAFARNGFVVLVGDEQIEDLDTVLDLRTRTEITFLKLVPLVGG